ncbi:hypothetical protein Q3G72_030473 [Acer saccharum]|nr:hypothetical protein Q3G72_030473 [Acer saccharum]
MMRCRFVRVTLGLVVSIFQECEKGKLSEEVPSKPTDPLTEASVLDSSSNREKPTGSKTQSDAKASLNPAVRIVVVKKPVVAAPNTKITTKSTENNEEEKKPSDASIGLQSLCQYDSDDDEYSRLPSPPIVVNLRRRRRRRRRRRENGRAKSSQQVLSTGFRPVKTAPDPTTQEPAD